MEYTSDIVKDVLRLYDHGESRKTISYRTGLSHGKITKILVTYERVDTEEARMFREGMSVEEIAGRLKKTAHAVSCRIPYTKAVYGLDNPSDNAVRIRRHRNKDARSNKNK